MTVANAPRRAALLLLWACAAVTLSLAGCEDQPLGEDPEAHWWVDDPRFAGIDLSKVDVESTLALEGRDIIHMKPETYSG